MLVVLYNLFDCNLLFVPIAPVQFQQRFKTSRQALPEYTRVAYPNPQVRDLRDKSCWCLKYHRRILRRDHPSAVILQRRQFAVAGKGICKNMCPFIPKHVAFNIKSFNIKRLQVRVWVFQYGCKTLTSSDCDVAADKKIQLTQSAIDDEERIHQNIYSLIINDIVFKIESL